MPFYGVMYTLKNANCSKCYLFNTLLFRLAFVSSLWQHALL